MLWTKNKSSLWSKYLRALFKEVSIRKSLFEGKILWMGINHSYLGGKQNACHAAPSASRPRFRDSDAGGDRVPPRREEETQSINNLELRSDSLLLSLY